MAEPDPPRPPSSRRSGGPRRWRPISRERSTLLALMHVAAGVLLVLNGGDRALIVSLLLIGCLWAILALRAEKPG